MNPGAGARPLTGADAIRYDKFRVKKQQAQPEHVAIVGMGPSAGQYENIVKRLGSRRAFADETWCINAIADVLNCDRVFHMDDVRVQEIRAQARPESNIARMLEWMRLHPGPIYTSFPHKDYPGLVPFPLEAVANATGYVYFNSTAAYAVALAVYLGVKKLTIFGNDFTYPNAHHAEKGRACVEFWLGIGAARGMQISIPRESSLMDACHPFAERVYGYDAADVKITDRAGGGFDFKFTDKALLTAEEYEARYDHTVHPNALVT
jgi:hypothetical protein